MNKNLLNISLPNIPEILYVLIFLLIILGIFIPEFRTMGNILNIAQQGAVLAIIALGSCIITIIGGIDLSLGAVLSLAGMFTALLLKENFNLIISLMGGIGCGLICGLITGIIIAYGNVPSFVATLGMMSMARGISLGLFDGATISGLPKYFRNFANGYIGVIPIPIVIVLICYVILEYLMKREKFGIYIYALGGNQNAARCCGINSKILTMIVYTIGGLLAGIAGIIMVSRLNCRHPTVGIGYEFEAIVAVVVGGTPLEGGWGSLGRTLIGVIIIGVLKNGLMLLGYPSYWQMAIIGVGVVLALIMANMAFIKSKEYINLQT